VSEPRLSPATKALLRAARHDGPGAAARAKVWSAVSGAVGGAAGVSSALGAGGTSAAGGGAASSAMVTGGTSVAKMFVMGTLLGGAVTVGLASVLLRIGPAPSPPSASAPLPVAAAAAPPGTGDSLAGRDGDRQPDILSETAAAGTPPTTPVLAARISPAAATARPTTRPAGAASNLHAGPAASPTDDVLLGQETALIIEARAALSRGDAQGALRAVRAARALPSHRLAPEELSVEGQALRALGRDDEARDADSMLRKQFPESALAR
jgi:hypothetical protein